MCIRDSSHAGVVAREYGLPAVLGVTDALAHIATGDLMTIDGSTGTVLVTAGASVAPPPQ